jgi:hypothetical protein
MPMSKKSTGGFGARAKKTNNYTRMINGRKYKAGMMPPVVSVPVQVELAKVLGPAMGAIAGGGSSAAQMMAAVAGNLDADKTLELMQTVFEYMSCDGQRFDFESHFVGKNAEMWQVFLFGLEVNYADFLDVVQSGSLMKAAETEEDLDIVDAP